MEEPKSNPTAGQPDYREYLASKVDYNFSQANTDSGTKSVTIIGPRK